MSLEQISKQTKEEFDHLCQSILCQLGFNESTTSTDNGFLFLPKFIENKMCKAFGRFRNIGEKAGNVLEKGFTCIMQFE